MSRLLSTGCMSLFHKVWDLPRKDSNDPRSTVLELDPLGNTYILPGKIHNHLKMLHTSLIAQWHWCTPEDPMYLSHNSDQEGTDHRVQNANQSYKRYPGTNTKIS